MGSTRQVVTLTHGWEFRRESDLEHRWSAAADTWRPALPVPSTIHQDLIYVKDIPDPHLAKNEDEVQWIGSQVWSYRKTFTIPEDIRKDQSVKKHLVFDGLDTYATVRLDGREILKSENMFISQRIDISNLVGGGGISCHLLEVTFDNAEKIGDEEVAQHPDHHWGTFTPGKARLATRKAQYHYGWDWGPKLMTCGLWRPVHLEFFRSRLSLLSAQVTLSRDLQEAQLNVLLHVDGDANFAIVDLEYQGTIVTSQPLQINPTTRTGTTLLKIKSPRLWWPHTFGDQPMYNLNANLFNTKDAHDLHDTATRRIGIRKVELIQHSFGEQGGSSFYFKVNNVPIFAGGSNWIPGDSFLPRIPESTYRKWVTAAKQSNQVMIRVWGGGIYESEAFYNACDEMGILVWQDFMFACGMYPAYERFLAKVEEEAQDNIRKLRHHPCIVLWCGNNEDYVIPLITGIEYDTNEQDPETILRSSFPARYTYEHLLPRLCEELVPDAVYWPGSPFAGDMCNSQTEGDIHQWHVWHMEKFPYQDFPRLSGRFVSEFGMQAMPSLRTARDFFLSNDQLEDGRDYAEDEFLRFHNKCTGGVETLNQYCRENLPLVTDSLSKYIYCTQLLQSETIATAFRSCRRLWRGEGKEYCGGALIWQLNDCCPVTSWSLIDYNLRPKMGFWSMKRENKPITGRLQRVKGQNDTARLEAWAVNMSLQDVTVDVHVRAWNVVGGNAPIGNIILHQAFTLSSNCSIELGTIDPIRLGLGHGQDYNEIVFSIDLTTTRSNTLLDQSISFHEPLKDVPFTRPTSLHSKLAYYEGHMVVELKAPCALKGVLIEVIDQDPMADGVTFDDNGFDLLPHQLARAKVTGLSLGDEYRLKINSLGGEWQGAKEGSFRASL